MNLKDELAKLSEKYEKLANQYQAPNSADQIVIQKSFMNNDYDKTISVPRWEKSDMFRYSVTHDYWECIMVDT